MSFLDSDDQLDEADQALLNAGYDAQSKQYTSTSSPSVSSQAYVSKYDNDPRLSEYVVAAGPSENAHISTRPKLTQEQIIRRRAGHSRITSTDEFRQTYKEFKKTLSDVELPSHIQLESSLTCEDIFVDTPVNTIQKAIDREIEQYRIFFQSNREVLSGREFMDYSNLPDLGASVPSIVDLEQPLSDLKRERFQALVRRSLEQNTNALTVRNVMQGPPLKGDNLNVNPILIQDNANSNPINNQLNSGTVSLSSHQPIPLLPDQVILRVDVYNSITLDKLHELLVLDQQKLTVLRDAISCIADEKDSIDWTHQIPQIVCHARHLPEPHKQTHNTNTNDTTAGTPISPTACCRHGVPYGTELTTRPLSSSSAYSSPPPPPSFGPPLVSIIPPQDRNADEVLTQLKFKHAGRPLSPSCMSLPTPSGYFFFENTFYDDMRAPTSIRLSDTIIRWTAERNRHLHHHLYPYQQKDMDSSTFADLKIRLGAQYLYQHQGDCKHVVVFTDMRMATDQDVNDQSMYPLILYTQKEKAHKCTVCDIMFADVVTYNDRLAVENPSYFCTDCYDALHRDEQGKLLFDDFDIFRILPLRKSYKLPLKVIHT